MYQVSFGDGTSADNDSANVINFDGEYPEWIGRSFGTAIVERRRASERKLPLKSGGCGAYRSFR